tara:strand:+ start:9294 stop:10967 length:1674 start_codon:yes stop_codon:yes gene_type:complete
MAEFTKDIQTLTQQAGASPQLQTNTGSLATDVISAASFGLGLYRQNQAQAQLGAAKQQQVEYNTRIAEGTLKMREWRQMQKDNGVTGNAFRRAEKRELDKLGDANFQMELIGGLNKLTRQTSGEVMDSITKAEVTEAKRVEDRQLVRQEREVSIVTAAYTAGMAIGNPSEMTEGEMDKVEIQSARIQAETNATNAKLQREREALTDKAAKQNQDNKIWAFNTGVELGNVASSDLGTFVKQQGGVPLEGVPKVIERLNSYKQNITKVVNARAQQSETYISPDAISTMINNLEQGVNNTIALFTKDESLKALQNNADSLYQGNLNKMFSGTANERTAVNSLYSSKFIGLPQEMTSFNTMLEFVSGSMQGNVDPDKEDFDTVLRNLPNVMQTNGAPTEESQDTNQKIIDGLFNNSPAKIKSAVIKGALDATTKAIVAQGKGVVSAGKATETADLIYKAAVPSLAGNIQRLMMQETSNNPTNSEFGSMGMSQDFRNNYEFDVNTMQFNKTNRTAGRNAQIEQVNLLIRNTRKSFTELGMDSTYVNGFDEDILLTLGLAPTK